MKVLFVKEFSRSVLAVFPFRKYTFSGYRNDLVVCYSHIGQHSACAKEYYKPLPKAKKSEYKNLLNELKQIGYKIDVINETPKDKKTKKS